MEPGSCLACRSPTSAAQRLINTYCYVTEPDAVERLTRGELSLYDRPRGDFVEFECDVYGELVSWLLQDEIDALVYGW